MNFGSDNTAPAHPRIMEAVVRANAGHALAYGDDPLTAGVTETLRTLFEAPEAEVMLVATGTAANSLALAALVKPWEAIFCSALAHIHTDECGAPEFYSGGAKLVLVEETHARIAPEHLDAAIREGFERGLHYVQPGAVALTQVTERGTVYGLGDLQALSGVAHGHGLPVHLDGARFANALVSLGCTPAEMTWRAGIDAVSFGATKNGCLDAEAILVFDPARARDLGFRRKRAGHLFSKHRFLAAQMAAYLENGLWLETARASNAAAARLAQGLEALPHARIEAPVEANIIFVTLPRAAHRRAVEGGAQYYKTYEDLAGGTEEDAITARLVTNWGTTDEEIDRFVELLK